MVSSLPLPTPDPTSDVWGEDLNAAITAVNNDLEATKDIQASKADSAAVTSALALKADTSTVTSLSNQVGTKADQTALDAAVVSIDAKADQTALDSAVVAIDAKADQTALDAALVSIGTKADQTALDSGLATKTNQVDFVELETRVDALGAIPLFLEEGELIPAGSPAGTVIYRSQSHPEDVKVTHVSNNKSEPISNFELPDDLAVGDVVLAIAVTTGQGRSYIWAAPWTEIFDYSQNRTISAAIYRIVDDAALDAIVVPTITPQGNFDSMVLVTMKIDAQNAPWPAYSAGGGRSPATLVSPTNTGFSINTISSSPFTSFDTGYAIAAAYSGILGGPAPDISLPGTFETIVDSTTGGLALVIGKRAVSTVPVSAVAVGVTHPAGFENALYGGGQFIVPAKEA